MLITKTLVFTTQLLSKRVISVEHLLQAVPFETPIQGFGESRRIRIVAVPTGRHFEVNLKTPGDIAVHFNPRFDVSFLGLFELVVRLLFDSGAVGGSQLVPRRILGSRGASCLLFPLRTRPAVHSRVGLSARRNHCK